MSLKFILEEYHRNISEDELIRDLKRVASELNKDSVTRDEQDTRGRFHSSTFIKRFGSWFNALEKANLQKTRTPMNLPEDELFKNLEEIWTKLGRQPRYAEIQKPFSKYSVGTYEHRFGTYRNALEKFVAYINKEPIDISKVKIEKINTPRHKTTRNINWRLRFLIMRRDNFKCRNCGRSPATDPSIILHVDHVKAWSNNGETLMDNLQTLCSVCNIGKSNL